MNKTLKNILITILCLPVGAFLATQIIYWLNLDNKLIFRVVYPLLQKWYKVVKRDTKF